MNIGPVCPDNRRLVQQKLAYKGLLWSGSLPLDQRKAFKGLIEEAPKRNIENIFVESARALSRDADVGEEIYKKSKEQQ